MKMAATIALLVILGCRAPVAPARMVETSNPDDMAMAVWEYEWDPADQSLTEQDVVVILDGARRRWPGHWEFPAMTASHYVRSGDASQAATYHQRAHELFVQNPPVRDSGMGTAAAVGGLIGIAVYAVATGGGHATASVLPPEPAAVTWSPPLGSHYEKDR